MQTKTKTGVGATVDAFNFIRRIAFPTTSQILSLYVGVAICSSLLSLALAGESWLVGLEFGVGVLVAPPIIGSLLGAALLANRDNVLDFRRLMGMEFVALLPLAVIFPFCSLSGLLVGARNAWETGFLLGLAISFPVRFLTSLAMASVKAWRTIGAALSTPLINMAAFLTLTPTLLPDSSLSSITVRIYTLFVSGIALSGIGTGLIVQGVERDGTAEIGHSPMDLFRAFLNHWLKKTPTDLEDRLLTLSTDGDIETKILSFSGSDGKPKAAIIVSNFHPGPYRDLGSGGLPSEIKKAVEAYQEGTVVQVPHGISNHKLNIVSHRDIKNLIEAVKANLPTQHASLTVTSMIRERVGEATVSGQAFGKTALLTVTLAPNEMEDLPTEVAFAIDRAAETLGFQALTIDAHNSIESQTSITTIQAHQIIEAATLVLKRLNSLPQNAFKVGATENELSPFTLKDGIGPGGLAELTVATDGQTVAYITVDGNNMQRGLREKILHSLKDNGIDDAEILTTDTHLVTGLVRSPLGYYPVGSGLPTESFIQTVAETVREATIHLEQASTGLAQFSMHLPVLGSEAFDSISGFIGRIARQVGRGFYRLEILVFIIALLVILV